jgi:hypothetical protein
MEKVMADTKMVTPGALDKLAKLLAAENIMVEHRPIKTAYFDVKNRVLALPMWKEMTETLYHMLVLHEVGHALETPADGWKGAIDKVKEEEQSSFVAQTFQGYLNVVEDARIERKIKNKFPGSRRDFLDGYDWLHEQDFFSVKSRNVDELSLIDRINLYFKLGARIRIKFNEEEQAFVKRAEQALTFDEVIKLAEDLLAYAKKKKEENDEEEEQMMLTVKSDEGDEGDDEDSDFDFDEDGDESDSDSDGDTEEEEQTESSNKEESGGKLSGRGSKPLEEATTDQAMNDRMEELLDPSLSNYTFSYIHFPKDVTHEEFVVGYRELLSVIDKDFARAKDSADLIAYRNSLLNKFRSENNSAINYMVKEFERKKAAVAYSRSKQAKTGVIDTNKLHSYKFNDDIFKRLSIEPNGKNHGVVAMLDMSGSMMGSYRGAMDQLISLAMFCRRVGIPHRLYGFTQCAHRFTQENNNRSAVKKAKLRSIMTRMNDKSFVFPDLGFDLVEFFHEKMSLKEFNTMVGTLLVSSKLIQNDWGDMIAKESARTWIYNRFGFNNYQCPLDYLGLSGTPLNDAILVSRDLMAKFRKEKNIEIMNFVCITDGESNDSQYHQSAGANRGHVVSSLPYGGSKVRSIFVDEESRLQTSMNFNYSHSVTAMFARTVRQSQNATFVGFYIVSSAYDVRHVGHRYLSYTEGVAFQDKWRKTKSAVIPDMLNFDEFYIINGGRNLRTQQASLEEANNEMKKGQLARAFISAQNKRGASRAILGKFIEKIAA